MSKVGASDNVTPGTATVATEESVCAAEAITTSRTYTLGEKAPQVPTRQMRLTPWRENSSVA